MKNNILPILSILFLLVTINCKEKSNKKGIDQNNMQTATTISGIDIEDFNSIIDGEKVAAYVLRNENGMEAIFTNYGQRLISLMTPDKEGDFDDVVLGFPTLDAYKKYQELLWICCRKVCKSYSQRGSSVLMGLFMIWHKTIMEIIYMEERKDLNR